jgi:hypothetical protein
MLNVRRPGCMPPTLTAARREKHTLICYPPILCTVRTKGQTLPQFADWLNTRGHTTRQDGLPCLAIPRMYLRLRC